MVDNKKELRFTDEEMAEVDRLQSDPTSEYYYNDPDNEEGFLDKVKRKLEPYGEDFKGFIEYLFTPSRHFGTGQYNEGGVAEQMEMFGYTAEGAQQEADKFVEEAGDLETDVSKAASFVVPFYDSGVNIANVAQEFMKPEQERDYNYIKSQFTEAGQSAAIEGGLLLMGGVAGKYGAKGIKALADKVKQYEIDPTAMSVFGAGAIRKKPTIKEGVPTIEAAGLTDEAIETWRKKNATSPEFRKALKGRDEELMDLAAGVKEGRVFNTTYRKRVDELRPIRKVKDVPKPSNVKEIVSALDSGKRKSPIVGLNYEIPDGEVITARLDIPAYVDYDTWIPTLRHTSKTMYKAALRMKNVKFIQPEGREVGSALDVAVGPQRLEETFGLTKKKAQAKGNKSPFAVMEGSYIDGTDDELFTMAKEIFDSGEWTQVGYDPVKRGFFYDRETKQAILEADEVIQVGHLVLAKNAKKTDPDVFPFNKGGAVMDDQMKMFFMNEGGLKDEGGSVDPESGNDVPIGSTKKEVRDDIPAMLSEGEFVFPADVVRYIGLEKLMELRQSAKMGLKKMEAMGQMGNSEEATLPDDMPFDMADLVIIEGSDEPKEMAQGGVIKAQTGTFVVPKFDPRNQDVRQYKNEAGEVRNIPFYNGKPAYPIPVGFVLVGTDIPTEEKPPETVAPVEDGGGGGDRDKSPVNAFTEAGSWNGSPLDMYIKEAKKVSTYGNVAAGVGAAFNPLIGGFMAVAIKNEKRKILATIDDRIKQAKTTEEKNELEDIKDRLTNPERKGILGQIVKEVVAPITNALGITDPKQAEVVSNVAEQTAKGDVIETDQETKEAINAAIDAAGTIDPTVTPVTPSVEDQTDDILGADTITRVSTPDTVGPIPKAEEVTGGTEKVNPFTDDALKSLREEMAAATEATNIEDLMTTATNVIDQTISGPKPDELETKTSVIEPPVSTQTDELIEVGPPKALPEVIEKTDSQDARDRRKKRRKERKDAASKALSSFDKNVAEVKAGAGLKNKAAQAGIKKEADKIKSKLEQQAAGITTGFKKGGLASRK